MENTLSVTLMIAFLLIGAVGGAVLAPQDDAEIEYVDRVEYVNNTVETIVEISAPDYLDLALAEFKLAFENEEDAAGNDFEAFDVDDYDKVSVSKLGDDYRVEFTEDGYTVYFDAKVRFEDNNDVDKEWFSIEVIFEEGEDTSVYVD